MQIIFLSIVNVLCAFLIPKRNLKLYMYGATSVLAFLYLFFEPPIEYDLYRHYEMFDQFSKLSFSHIYLNNDATISMYLNRYPVYMLFLAFLSRLHIRILLPVITGCVVYWLAINTMFKVLDRKSDVTRWKYIFGYFVIIFGYDFIAISGIRNILAVSIFAFVVFQDFVMKRNKLVCFLIYFLCCFIHSICFVYLILRLIMIINNKFTKFAVLLLVSMLFYFTSEYYNHLNSIFAGFRITQTALKIFHDYTVQGGSGGTILKGTLCTCIFLYVAAFFAYMYFRRFIIDNKEYSNYSDYFLLTLIFTVGSYSQYDIFVRYSMFIVPFLMVFIVETVYYVHGNRCIIVNCSKRKEILIYLVVFSIVVFSLVILFLYNSLYKYFVITEYLRITNIL